MAEKRAQKSNVKPLKDQTPKNDEDIKLRSLIFGSGLI